MGSLLGTIFGTLRTKILAYKPLILAFVFVFVFAFYIGWAKRGEAEAMATALALQEAIEKESIKWQKQTQIAIKQAQTEATENRQTETITREVIRYVETSNDDPICYDDHGVQLITKAIGDP